MLLMHISVVLDPKRTISMDRSLGNPQLNKCSPAALRHPRSRPSAFNLIDSGREKCTTETTGAVTKKKTNKVCRLEDKQRNNNEPSDEEKQPTSK